MSTQWSRLQAVQARAEACTLLWCLPGAPLPVGDVQPPAQGPWPACGLAVGRPLPQSSPRGPALTGWPGRQQPSEESPAGKATELGASLPGRGQPPWKGPASLEGASLPGKDLPPGRDLPESLHLLVRPAGASSHALPRLGAGSWVQRAWQAVTSRATAGLFLRRCGGAPGTGVPASSGPGGLGPCLCCCHLQFCPGSP